MSVFAPESFDLSSLPCLSLSDKHKLPSCPAVYFALSSKGRVLYIGRSVALRERLRNHHRLHLLEALGGVKIAWLEQSNPFVLPRLETTLIKYFTPPLNRISSHLSKDKIETLLKELDLNDKITKSDRIPINKCLKSQLSKRHDLVNQIQTERKLHPHFEDGGWQPSELKELILEQSKSIEHLEERLADLKLMFHEQMQAHRQLTEALVEQAKAISELSRTQAETNSQLSKVTVEQAVAISKLSRALEETRYEDKAED